MSAVVEELTLSEKDCPVAPKEEPVDLATYVYSIRTRNGFEAVQRGTLTSVQHGWITRILDGQVPVFEAP